MLDKLYEGHRQVEASVRRLSALLDADQPDMAKLTVVRWEIGTRIMQHLALEDRHLYANFVAHHRPDIVALGKKFQAAFARHLSDYAAYAQRWTAEQVKANWHVYRLETREEIRKLRERIALAETELYPLARSIVDISVARPPSHSWAREAFAIKASVAPQR